MTRPSDLDESKRLAWQELCNGDPLLASPFYSFQFSEAVERSGVDVRICVLERDNRPIGFFPFQFAGAFARRLAAAERVGEEMSDRCGIVAEPALQFSEDELLYFCRLSSFSFTHLDEIQNRHGLSGGEPEPGLLINMTRGTAAYWQEIGIRDSGFARDTRRRARSVAEKFGALRFEFREKQPHELLDHLIQKKREQYARTGVSDALGPTWKRKLLHQLADVNELEFSGVLSTLYAGDTWLASHFGIRSRGVLHHWFPVYDAEMSRYAPGRLLNQCLVEAAEKHSFSIIDFGAGDTSAKRDFANASDTFVRGRWERSGLRSLFFGASMSIKWRINALRKR